MYRCEVFRAMFSTPTTSDENAPLILSDVKPIVFMAVLEFIYTNSCNLTADIVCSCVVLLCVLCVCVCMRSCMGVCVCVCVRACVCVILI